MYCKLKSNDKLKKVSTKNHTCYYSYDIIKFEDFDIDNILIDEKSYENILVYSISLKNLMGAKHLRIRFNKIDGFFKVHGETRYLILLGDEKYDLIYNRIRYPIRVKIEKCSYK